MKRHRSILITALAVSFLSLAAAVHSEELREEFSRTYDVPSGGLVSVNNVNGSMEIGSWDRSEVLVEATKVIKVLGRDRAREAMERLEIEVSERPSGLEIATRLPRSSSGIVGWIFGRNVNARVSYRIKVPADIEVRAETVNGNVTVESVDGGINATTTNGKIRIRDSGGGAKASATNGSIRAEFSNGINSGGIDLRTTNGGITVYVPEDLKCSVDASSMNGSITSDFAISIESPRGWGRKKLRGDINGGGGPLSLRSVNGSIQLRKRGSSS